MIAGIYEFVLNRPAFLRALGSLFWRSGWLGLLAGVMAKTLTAVLAVATSMGGSSAQATYHMLFPGVPTWWVPESAVGAAVYIGLVVGGYLINVLAAQVHRLLRAA